jgi:NAD(P)H-dependent FMN reductase
MKYKIGIIIGSTRPGRVGENIAKWYLSQIKQLDAEFELIDLAKINLPLLDEAIPASAANYQNEHTKKWSELIGSFDAFVWVTPEYNHAAPASLTNAISYIYKEWVRKPVALVSYGSMGGVRAAEHLRQIAGELQMADIRPTVMIREPWAAFDDDGNIRNELVAGEPTAQIEDLLWWTQALRSQSK